MTRDRFFSQGGTIYVLISAMYESLQNLMPFLWAFAIGEIVYGTIVNLLVRALRKHLTKKSFSIFQAGLALIGAIDLLGTNFAVAGILLCIVAVFVALLEDSFDL
jgi:zinc transporter ZupT